MQMKLQRGCKIIKTVPESEKLAALLLDNAKKEIEGIKAKTQTANIMLLLAKNNIK